jgi:hypothetical protein
MQRAWNNPIAMISVMGSKTTSLYNQDLPRKATQMKTTKYAPERGTIAEAVILKRHEI